MILRRSWEIEVSLTTRLARQSKMVDVAAICAECELGKDGHS